MAIQGQEILACPSREGQPCLFPEYCARNKSAVEDQTDPANQPLSQQQSQGVFERFERGGLVRKIPTELVDARKTEWCSEEQIRAIGEATNGLLARPSLDHMDAAHIIKASLALTTWIKDNRDKAGT